MITEQASVNYRKIADGFSLALVETCSDLHFVNKTVSISDSHEMRRLVVELYVGVFKLLCHAMDWFKRGKKRFFTSFNSSFHNDTVEALVRSIQKTVQRVKDEAQHIAHGRVERIEGMLVDHILRLRSVGIDSRNDSLETIGQKLGNAREVLGHSSARTLGSVENQHMYGMFTSIVHPACRLGLIDIVRTRRRKLCETKSRSIRTAQIKFHARIGGQSDPAWSSRSF